MRLESETILNTADHFADLNGMGTTIASIVVLTEKILIAHLGDSRCYSYDGSKLKQITEDHSSVHELVEMEQITEQQAGNHPQKNIITEASGVSSTVSPELNILEVHAGDTFLLCIGGLTSSLTDPQIQQILATKNLNLKERCNELISEASCLDDGDNIIVCLLACVEKGGDK